ncbi:SIR2 family protein [Magnetovibrio sp. PR-2]|uniref:SIR2 family protein n=1 Tax=Magnetovibrio sp. PR-2 TaxID=3120356 RepID=UPI002FCE275F
MSKNNCLQHFTDLRERGQLRFLVGAGISIDSPSCIPPAGPILDVIFEWLSAGDQTLLDRLHERARPGNRHTPFDFLRFEAVIQAIAQPTPSIVKHLRVLETAGVSNSTHLFLALLSQRGNRILTTNFDTRFEETEDFNEVPCQTHLLSPRAQVPPSDTNLIKLHGSFPRPMRGGNHNPKATLNQIGSIGLAFEHMPKFVDWFVTDCAQKTLFVMGYSSSDSFDVVPLLEQHFSGDELIWFDFDPACTRVSRREIRHSEPCILPADRTTDFVGLCLSNIKNNNPDCRVYRVKAPSLERFLTWAFGPAYAKGHRILQDLYADINPGELTHMNLSDFTESFSFLELTVEERKDIAHRLINEDAFGETMLFFDPGNPSNTDDEEEADVPRHESIYEQVVGEFYENGITSAHELCQTFQAPPAQTPDACHDLSMAQAFIQLEMGDIKQGFETIEQSFIHNKCGGENIMAQSPDIFLMYAEGEFGMYHSQDDFKGMARARAKIRRISRKSGAIWGLVLWHLLMAREFELRIRKQFSPALLDEAIQHSAISAYYFLRTGTFPLLLESLRMHTYFLDLAGHKGTARLISNRLLTWLPENEIEERMVCLSNLVTLCVDDLNANKARKHLAEMQKLQTQGDPNLAVFVALAEAELAMLEKDVKKVDDFISLGETMLAQCDTDPWNHAFNIKATRQKAVRIAKVLEKQSNNATALNGSVR